MQARIVYIRCKPQSLLISIFVSPSGVTRIFQSGYTGGNKKVSRGLFANFEFVEVPHYYLDELWLMSVEGLGVSLRDKEPEEVYLLQTVG